MVGRTYLFQPNGSDPNGDPLTFSIANKPAWASFDTATGRLSGVPDMADRGAYSNIRIAVSDGDLSDTLPSFSVSVEADNRPPRISGSPPAEVAVGEDYLFQASASDPDGDTLTFSVSNLPAWADFDPGTGWLSGSPAPGDEGVYGGIVIEVSDGQATAALPTFAVRVEALSTGSLTLNWLPPTENTDGSPLTDLAGYRVYYGTAPRSYGDPIELDNPGLSSYVLENLAANTRYYVSVTAVNATGRESDFSNEASALPTR